MGVGNRWQFRCHEDSAGLIVLDKIFITPFSHDGVGGGVTPTVVKDDQANTPNDAWIVTLDVMQGSLSSFGAAYSQGDMIDDCTNMINAAFGTGGAGPNTPSSGFL